MSACFGDAAARLSGLAAQLLGWRPHEFWAATPAELSASLAPLHSGSGGSFDRTTLNRMMEQDHGNLR